MGNKKTKKKKLTQKELIEETNQKVHYLIKKVDKLDRDFNRFEIMNFIRFFIVMIPVIIAILYLIPVFREFISLIDPLIEMLEKVNTL